MKNSLLWVALVVGLAGTSTVWAQPKYDKALKKASDAYKNGAYENAKAALDKAKKKIDSKLGASNQYTPIMQMMQARYQLALGLPLDFETELAKALKIGQTVYGDNGEKYGLMLIEAAQLHNLNGSYRTARELLDQSKKILESSNSFRDPNKAYWEVEMGETLTGQGYYANALELLLPRVEFFSRRAVKQETLPDGKGGLKSQKLPEDEVDKRLNDYARAMTLAANTYGRQGSPRSADSLFLYAGTWIKRNLGESSFAYIRNQFYNANILVENGNITLPKDLQYERLLNMIRSSYAPSHYLTTRIFEEYLKQLLREENTSRFANVKAEYEKVIDKEYPKKSIYKVRFKAVEFDSKLSKSKTKDLENSALLTITNTENLPHNNSLTAEVLDFLASFSASEKKYDNVEKYLKEIIDIQAALLGDQAPETHLARIRLANHYLDNTNKISEAGAIYKDSYEGVLAKQIKPLHRDNLDILNHLGIYYELTDQYAKAIDILREAGRVSIAKYDDTDFKYGEELTLIARLQIKLGQYEDAEANIDKALKILDEFRKDDSKKGLIVNALDTKANIFGIKGLFDEASDALGKSSKIIRKAEADLGIDELSTAQDLASLFIQLGNYSATAKILEELLKEYETIYGSKSIRLIEPLVNKGRLLLAQGDYTEADKIAARANAIAVGTYGEKSTKSAMTQKLLGEIDYTIGDYEKAEANIVKALASQEKQFGRNHIEVAKSIGQLALIKFYKGDDKKTVEKLLTEARDIIGKRLSKDNPQYADMLKNMAILYISQKRYPEAFAALTQAEGIWRSKTGQKTSIQAASIFALTGEVYYQLKNYDKAEEFYKYGKDLYERYFSNTHPEYVKILSKMARVYYMKKDFKASKKNIEQALTTYESFIKQYFPALSEREKAKYWNTIRGDFEFYNTLAFSQLEDFRDLSGKVYNYQLLTKALLLSSSIKMKERILSSNDEALKASYTQWVQQKELLTNALSMSTQQLADNGIDPNALSNEVEQLEKQLSEKSEIFGSSFENKRITYENVQSALAKNEVAVEVVRFRHFNHNMTDSVVYIALYVKGDKSRPKVIPLPDGQRMETRYYRNYRNSITGKLHDDYSYKIYWEPLQKELGTFSTIYFSPDGVYNLINLEAIPTPDGKYVIDNSNIVLVSNTKDLYLRKVKNKDQKVTVGNKASMFGNPTFYTNALAAQDWTDLPGTEKEVTELNKLLKQKGWSTDEFTEANASEEKVKELDNPRIFHIATHGFYAEETDEDAAEQMTENEAMMAENPLMKSGLLLKGAGDIFAKTKHNYNIESGVLTAYEAMSLNLDKTDLVVLSACETGLGQVSNGEGVYGLQRAFLVAGAKVLIMSMFKVDDEATQKLILSFYRKWLNSGNLRQSFVEAKKELRNEMPDPIYWGSFMMIGLD